MNNSPYLLKAASVQSVMLRVLLALLPGLAAYVWFFGAAIMVQIVLTSLTALAAEALVLYLRGKPLALFLTDGSALVTAWLIALSFPPLTPWWLVVLATLIAIIVAKHLYGGLGQNPFNPAMVAFALMIVAYPQFMSRWPGVDAIDFATQWNLIFGLHADHALDALTMATPLDALRTALHSTGTIVDTPATVANTLANNPAIGHLASRGWEWIAAGYLAGGLWLVQQRIITWHLPAAFLATLFLLSGLASFINPADFAGPLFHLFGGGAMLAAFFIVTDPVSAATTPCGKLIFAAGVALLTWVIRSFGAYPDGIAFAVLLMNTAVPLIDMTTQPRVFGHKKNGDDRP
ncbi:electron transporter RnfD [Rugosibacter aromaticivorans]|uniref:Ion-translocating oxidoreductase complex subunit D n=1 Tax=Rugosibacter aromaticivorans TaxID=1565605 RepID=A0A0C5JAX4_9PROT|nr:RnfABCDGE type electron transport complex subunit D [Rugosibacter aromaticivorans]AJP48958.1 electron transporter RnfD [Rugosibacter aromaticivorans]